MLFYIIEIVDIILTKILLEAEWWRNNLLPIVGPSSAAHHITLGCRTHESNV